MDTLPVDSIICPRCGRELPASAQHCQGCGAATASDAVMVAELAPESRLRDRPWVMAILLLHLGVFGIPLYWKAKYSRSTRLWIVIASILYTLLVAAVVAWGCMQMYRLLQVM